MDLSGVLSRSMDGWIEFHAVSEETARRSGAVAASGHASGASSAKRDTEFVSRAVRVPLRSSQVADMRDVLGLRKLPLPPGVAENSLLGELGVTEGCMVTFTDHDVRAETSEAMSRQRQLQ